jgi:predicted transcriptional regulator of viral defense system
VTDSLRRRLAVAGAVVSHESALEMLDLSDVIADEVHLTLPRAKRGLRIPPGVRAHFSTRPIHRSQQTRVLGVPVTSVERTLADQLRAVGWSEQIDFAVQQAVRRGLTWPARLEVTLPATGGGALPRRSTRSDVGEHDSPTASTLPA